jgi:hypothetical protein
VRVHGKLASRPPPAQPRPSSYAHEPNSQEHKPGRNDRLAAPLEPRPGWSLGSRRRLEPLLSSTQELHHGTAAGHGCSVRSCRVRAARAGMAATLAASRCSQRMPWGRRVRRQPMTSSPGRSGLGGSRGRSPAAASASSCGWTVVATTVSVPSGQPRPATRTPGPRSHHPYPPGALAVHGHAAADHQVHGLQLAQRQSAARRSSPGWARPCTGACRRPGRVPGPGAGGVRVGLEHPGRRPLRERGQPGSSEWSAGEIGDPSLGAREAGHPLALKEGPHALADRPLDPANLLQLTLGGRAQRRPPVRPPTRYSMSCWDKASRVASVTRITRMSGRRRSASVNRSRAW